MKKRQEYPRPQFERSSWLNLNGTWDFDFDDENKGDKDQWYSNHRFTQKIEVPFCYQSKLSGIGETDFHDMVWYKRTFTLPSEFEGKRIILHFGAVDYLAWVGLSGQRVQFYEGVHRPF